MCAKAAEREWVVHIKPPFGGPQRVLKYLARYTHRVAISNHRLRSPENGRVTFDWKDYADRGRTKIMTLDAVEFIRRFLLHVLPSGMVRIRQFGFLANRVRQSKLEECRTLLAVRQVPVSAGSDDGADPTLPDAHACPVCKLGRLIVIELLGANRPSFRTPHDRIARPFSCPVPRSRSGLGRSLSSGLRFRQTSSATPQIGLPVRPQTSRGPTRLTFQHRAALSVTGKSPFNTQ